MCIENSLIICNVAVKTYEFLMNMYAKFVSLKLKLLNDVNMLKMIFQNTFYNIE